MSQDEEPDDIEYDSLDEVNTDMPALAEPSDEQLMEAWDDANSEDYLPTIPGTAVLDTVQGSVYLWDSQCNKGLEFDGDLMPREDFEAAKAKA